MPSIIECFTGYIGILGCNSQEPGSGLYINSLPGITLEMVDGIADSEQITYLGVWNDVQKRSILRFRTLLMARINECYQINQRETIECIACENKDLLATSLWYLLGSELMTERIFTNRVNRYTTIDEAEAERLCSYFDEEMERELKLAVQGIDVELSDCLAKEKDCLQQNGPIHWRESAM